MIQELKLDEGGYRGARFDAWNREVRGNNDLLNLSRPDAVRDIHLAYFRAGADIVSTNTFSSTTIAQADYGMRWVPGPSPAVRAAPMGSVGRPIELNPTGIAPGVTPSAAPLPDDIPDDAVLPNRAYPSQRDQRAPVYQPPQRTAPVYQPSQRSVPALGPARAPQMVAASPATLTPAATLACST